MSHFVVEYDRPAGRLLKLTVFSDDERDAATTFLRDAETTKPDHVEVVMLSADSKDTLLKTHGRYFKTLKELATGT